MSPQLAPSHRPFIVALTFMVWPPRVITEVTLPDIWPAPSLWTCVVIDIFRSPSVHSLCTSNSLPVLVTTVLWQLPALPRAALNPRACFSGVMHSLTTWGPIRDCIAAIICARLSAGIFCSCASLSGGTPLICGCTVISHKPSFMFICGVSAARAVDKAARPAHSPHSKFNCLVDMPHPAFGPSVVGNSAFHILSCLPEPHY